MFTECWNLTPGPHPHSMIFVAKFPDYHLLTLTLGTVTGQRIRCSGGQYEAAIGWTTQMCIADISQTFVHQTCLTDPTHVC